MNTKSTTPWESRYPLTRWQSSCLVRGTFQALNRQLLSIFDLCILLTDKMVCQLFLNATFDFIVQSFELIFAVNDKIDTS